MSSWLSKALERRPDLAIRLEAPGGLPTFAHYGSVVWRRSRVERKVDLLEILRSQRIRPQGVLHDAFVDLRLRLSQAAPEGNLFPWWIFASRALWAILEEAMSRTLLVLGPVPDGFSAGSLEDVLVDPTFSRLGGQRTLLDMGSCEYLSSSMEEKLSLIRWTAEAGLSPAPLFSEAMRYLDARDRETGEDPASHAGFAAGVLVEALLRAGLR